MSATGLPEPKLRHVYRVDATVGPPIDLGDTPQGHRRIVPLTGGHFAGPELRGTLVAGGSADWQIIRPDGAAIGDIDLLGAASDDPSPERQAASRQELRRVTSLIAALPAKCREAFTLRKVEGLSQRDIALRMAISESTVEKHIGRALRTLMDAMKVGGPGASETSQTWGETELRANDDPRNQ